ncbi:crustacyanin-C1 subunit-like [Macrobrachium nipponense]|uniref:crustacyanin-C1 subunit-like n=1 Tax=Macrobrachium nipponense TaxID=159736 RepID=UPI0030C87A03
MPLGDPHLMVAFDNSFPAPLVILDTDYENYACLYSCMDYNFEYYSDFSFIFARTPTPSSTYIKKCETAFSNIGLDTSRFLKTAQGRRCPYNDLASL